VRFHHALILVERSNIKLARLLSEYADGCVGPARTLAVRWSASADFAVHAVVMTLSGAARRPWEESRVRQCRRSGTPETRAAKPGSGLSCSRATHAWALNYVGSRIRNIAFGRPALREPCIMYDCQNRHICSSAACHQSMHPNPVSTDFPLWRANGILGPFVSFRCSAALRRIFS
jgi:hypothetical protein